MYNSCLKVNKAHSALQLFLWFSLGSIIVPSVHFVQCARTKVKYLINTHYFVASFLLLVLCIAGSPVSNAQVIWGTVRATDGSPLPGVNVYIPSEAQGNATDINGSYEIPPLLEGQYVITFSFVGFQTEQRTVQVGGSDVELNVTLRPSIIEGDEVLIARERTEALRKDARSVSVLEPEQLAEVRGQTLGETLEHLPGIRTLRTGPSIAKPIVRGLHSQRVLVLNAGVSLEGQQWGGEHAPEIDPFAPVRIEVVKGVAGVEHGVGAIGGVIKLEPLELPYVPGTGIGGQFSANGFSNNLQGAGALYLEGAADFLPGLGWRVQGSFRKAGDTHTPDYVIGNSAFKELNGSASLGFRRDRLNVVALYSRFDTELGIFSGAHIGNLNDLLRAIERGVPRFESNFGYDIGLPKQSITHDLATIHGDLRLKSGHLVEVQYGFQHNHRQEFDAHGRNKDEEDLLDPAFDLSLISHSLALNFQHNPVGNLVGTVGVNGLNQLNKNDASGFLIPNFRALTGGVFVRESWVTDNLTLEAGVRFDYRWVRAWPRENGSRGEFVKRITDYASASGVLGAVWQFAPTWSVGINMGTGWRPPSVNELYNFGVHHGTAQFEIGDPDLESERSLGIDLTLRHATSRTRMEASVYNTSFDKFIYLFPATQPRVTIRGTFPTFFYTQSDAVLRGFDAGIEHELSSTLAVGIQASLVRGTNLDTDEPLINMPADRMIPRLIFHLPEGGIFEHTDLEIEGVIVAKQTRVPDNADYAEPPKGYTLFNAGISTAMRFDRTPLTLHLEVQNVFNSTYRDYLSRFRYFVDEPGRSIILRVQVPLGAR